MGIVNMLSGSIILRTTHARTMSSTELVQYWCTHSAASADPLTLQLSYKLLLSKSVTQRLQDENIGNILVRPCSVKIVRKSLSISQREYYKNVEEVAV